MSFASSSARRHFTLHVKLCRFFAVILQDCGTAAYIVTKFN